MGNEAERTGSMTDLGQHLAQGSMMTFGYSFNIWVPLLAFPTAGEYGAPRWPHGWPMSFVFYFLLWAGFIIAIVMHRRRFVD